MGLFDTTNMWYRNSSGIFTPGIDRTGTFCEALHECNKSTANSMFVVPNAAEDPRFANHPSVAHRPFARYYAGVPLLSFNGHCLGTLAAVDFHPKESPTKEKEQQLHEMSATVVKTLQEDLIKLCSSSGGGGFGENDHAGNTFTLPMLWVDVSTEDWRITGANAQWEQLTGVALHLLNEVPGGVLRVMGPADEAELIALRKAIATANRSENISLPSIMSPYAHKYSTLQFILALRPASEAPPLAAAAPVGHIPAASTTVPDIWTMEIHARVQASPPPAVRPPSLEGPAVSYLRGSSTSIGDISFTPAAEFNSDPYRTSANSDGSGSGGPKTASSGDSLPKIPPRLGSLQLGPLLGKGSYGSVYSGILRGHPVAVKIVEVFAGPKGSIQLQEAHFEALLGLQKQHENVLQTIDYLKEESTGQVWIVQELCDLGPLSAKLEEKAYFELPGGKPNLRVIIETALDVARGMQYLHSLDVLHADLSSNNVLLTTADNERGFLGKVTDFGLSRISKKEFSTKTVGTVSHMSPEVLVDGIAGKAGDVFSFGVMVYEVYTGKHAWEGSSLGQVIFAVTVKGTKLLLPANAPPELAALVSECQEADRNARPTFDDIVTRLEKMLEEVSMKPEAEGQTRT